MDGQPSPTQSEAMNTPTSSKRTRAALFLLLRLFVAFLCGWLLGGPIYLNIGRLIRFIPFLSDSLMMGTSNFFFYILLVFPLILGINIPSTVGKRNTHLIFSSLGTGLLVMAGIAAYWFPITIPSDAQFNAECAVYPHCHVGGIGTSVLIIYLIYGTVIVLLSSVITSLIIKHIRKNRQRIFYYHPYE